MMKKHVGLSVAFVAGIFLIMLTGCWETPADRSHRFEWRPQPQFGKEPDRTETLERVCWKSVASPENCSEWSPFSTLGLPWLEVRGDDHAHRYELHIHLGPEQGNIEMKTEGANSPRQEGE